MRRRFRLSWIVLLLQSAVGCTEVGSGGDAFEYPVAEPPTDAAEPWSPPDATGAGPPRQDMFDASSRADDDSGWTAPQPDAAGPEAEPDDSSGLGRSGSAIALSPDDAVAVAVNRDVGSVTVLGLDFDGEVLSDMRAVNEVPVGPGSEPYQAVFAPDGSAVYVVLRRDQELLKVGSLTSNPRILDRVAVGSEPVGLALDATGARAYVANWSDGTVSVVDTSAMQIVRTVDLNESLASSGYLGDVAPRPALAHPRAIAVYGGALYVTEFFAQQVEPESADGANADTHKVGLVYKVSVADWTVATLALAPLEDLGFRDEANDRAGCYPNQLHSIAVNAGYAYVLSVCASPEGPLGVKVSATECEDETDCEGLVEPACIAPFAGAAGNVCTELANVKTTTAPVISILDLQSGSEIAQSPVNLNLRFDEVFRDAAIEPASRRFPLFASEIVFVDDSTVGYVTANGADSVFRFQTDAESGAVELVGATTNTHIDLAPSGIEPDRAGKNPIGIAVGSQHKKVALVANDVSRNVSGIDFNTQALAGGVSQPQVVATTSLPVAGSDADRALRGKRFFNTGLGRWSLQGQGWGACQSCHPDGLTDNVTWYFARGPRQSTSLDGSFASTHPDDQRVFNWTATSDEIADFELNTRAVSGGVGAIVSAASTPAETGDRIDLAGLGHAGLDGSARQAADPANPLGLEQAPKLDAWTDIERYVQSIRSPRAPSNLEQGQVDAGRALFVEQANCQGCHGGEKWTVSRLFYTPSVATNVALGASPLALTDDFPLSLLPARTQDNQTLRLQGLDASAFDQILCVLRSVGTFGVSEQGVGIAELRADMATPAQGDGNPSGEGRGYNVPSLLGVSVGAPYLHAGSARTLEALFGATFSQHHQALSANFLTESDATTRAQRVAELVQYLLSIDEQAAFLNPPGTGAAGGSLCPQSF